MSAELRVVSPSDGPRVIAVPEAGLVLGREPIPRGGTVHKLANKAASGQHCRIWFDGQAWQIEDLDSANGTHLNGEPLVARRAQALQTGDKIQLGRAEVIVLVASFHVDVKKSEPLASTEATSPFPQVASLQQQLEAVRQELETQRQLVEQLRAVQRSAEAARFAAEERERAARRSEQEAIAALNRDAAALIEARDQLSELRANFQSQARDLVSYREKVALLETRESSALGELRSGLTQSTDRKQKLERELGQALGRIGELEVNLKAALANRDAALNESNRAREQIDNLEKVIETQSAQLRELLPR